MENQVKSNSVMVSKNRGGFTLVELLVVIAIIGVLVALLLPAVQAAREAARRASCVNNQKQIALAMHNYHDSLKRFPYGYLSSSDTGIHKRDTWMQQILPFVEQGNMYDKYMAWQGEYVMDTPPEIKDATIEAFQCPSEPNNPGFGGGGGLRSGGLGFQGNYVVCSGDTYMVSQATNLRGMFFRKSDTRFADVTDGTTNTIMLSESIIRDGEGGWGGAGGYWGGAPHASFGFATFESPNTKLPDRLYSCKTTTMVKAPCLAVVGDANKVNFARSYHPGGVLAAMGDGSVRFIADAIDLTTMRGLGTTRQGEVLGDF